MALGHLAPGVFHAIGAAEIAKVGEMREIARAGVLTTPAVAVDGAVKLAGRVPTAEEVQAWLSD